MAEFATNGVEAFRLWTSQAGATAQVKNFVFKKTNKTMDWVLKSFLAPNPRSGAGVARRHHGAQRPPRHCGAGAAPVLLASWVELLLLLLLLGGSSRCWVAAARMRMAAACGPECVRCGAPESKSRASMCLRPVRCPGQVLHALEDALTHVGWLKAGSARGGAEL